MTLKEQSGLSKPSVVPLAVHIVMHDFTENSSPDADGSHINAFATRLCEKLFGGERSPGIPVRLWRRKFIKNEARLPNPIPFEQAKRNLVCVLIDQRFFQARSTWQSYLTSMAKESVARSAMILPVAINADAGRVSSAFVDVNHIFVHESTPLCDDEGVFQAIYTVLLSTTVVVVALSAVCSDNIAQPPGATAAKQTSPKSGR